MILLVESEDKTDFASLKVHKKFSLLNLNLSAIGKLLIFFDLGFGLGFLIKWLLIKNTSIKSNFGAKNVFRNNMSKQRHFQCHSELFAKMYCY